MLINLRVNSKEEGEFWFKITGGTYTEMNSGWFRNVGSVLLFTMIVNTFSQPIVFLVL